MYTLFLVAKNMKLKQATPPEVKLEGHWKAIVRSETMKSGMCGGKGSSSDPVEWNENTGQGRNWKVRHLKESTHMWVYEDLLTRHSVEIDMVWELLGKKEREMTASLEQESNMTGRLGLRLQIYCREGHSLLDWSVALWIWWYGDWMFNPWFK